jgi:hypothetical protein
VPDFDYRAPSARRVLANHETAIAILILWLGVTLLAAYRAARRMRPV